MKLFDTDQTGHKVCVCSDDLARGIDIETTRAVINYELPRVYSKGVGHSRGPASNQVSGRPATLLDASSAFSPAPPCLFLFWADFRIAQLDIATYKHRMGRATRSEEASGVCINLVGSVTDTAAALRRERHHRARTTNQVDNEVELLRQLANTPELSQYGPQYIVPRETVGMCPSVGGPTRRAESVSFVLCPLRAAVGNLVEVKYERDDGFSDWRFCVVKSFNADRTVNVVTDDDDKSPIDNVSLAFLFPFFFP
jgi:hypothetical protein